MNNSTIKKLPQEIVNQIAAGEVIERPASVIKELLDNSIDAGAKNIEIEIKDGGLKLIQISDNGKGIAKEDLLMAFEPHATSKISDINDLNTLMTMGFRGEALSTIQSIARVTVISKTAGTELAYSLKFNTNEDNQVIQSAARTNGTTIRVEDLFFNIPARQKYLRSADTEFRKIFEILTPYFLIHPEITFKLIKDGKQYLHYLKIDGAVANTLHPNRIKDVIKAEYSNNLIDFYYEGDGAIIGGYTAHPNYRSAKSAESFVFVNNRPVNDKGIVRSVLQGYSRFIPFGEKIPFLIMVNLNPSSVDVNVHPRKEEVRFVNPYRVYSAIEQAITSALKKQINSNFTQADKDENEYNRLRSDSNTVSNVNSNSDTLLFDADRTSYRRDSRGIIKEVSFNKPTSFDIQKSLEFSREVLSDKEENLLNTTEFTQDFITNNGQGDNQKPVSISQIFNKYIIVEFTEEVWFIDQHAAAERAFFERLNRNLISDVKNIQHLLLAQELDLTDSQMLFIKENLEFFAKIGFEFEINEKVSLKSVPSDLAQADMDYVFKQMFDLSSESLDLENNYNKSREDIIATMACHSSVRAGQKLSTQECYKIYYDLMNCENKFSCPHGRPAIWKQKITDLDKHFLRTY